MSSEDKLFKENKNLSDCRIRFFLIESSVENTLSLWMELESKFGNDVDNNFRWIPSGRITSICNNVDPEYFAENS